MQQMGSSDVSSKPHAVCIPLPAQGHVNPMLKVAKLLHYKGFHITFVNTEFNHQRLLNARGSDSLNGFPDFKFEAIPDGLPVTDINTNQNDVRELCNSTKKNCPAPFRNLLAKLNDSSSSSHVPPVSCIVSDGAMSFTLDIAKELGVPVVVFWTTSACGFMCYLHYQHLIEAGVTPFKDESYLTNDYLDTPIHSIPGLMEGIRLRDLPSSIRTTDPNDSRLNFAKEEAERTSKASAIIFNTFDAFETEVLEAMKSLLPPPIYTIGPLQLLLHEIKNDDSWESLGSNLWKEDLECLKWLDSKEPNSVFYVSYGSLAVMTAENLMEFAWGLANSKHPFLWIIRPDLVRGEKTVILPLEFINETKERSFISSWCPQEQVLCHPSIGGFLTHGGWNSILDTVCGGVPIISWPFFAEQMTNCRYSCDKWGIGMEIGNIVKREQVERLVRELMEGEKGKQMKKNVMDWKKKAREATKPGGSSYFNFNKLVNQAYDSSTSREN